MLSSRQPCRADRRSPISRKNFEYRKNIVGINKKQSSNLFNFTFQQITVYRQQETKVPRPEMGVRLDSHRIPLARTNNGNCYSHQVAKFAAGVKYAQSSSPSYLFPERASILQQFWFFLAQAPTQFSLSNNSTNFKLPLPKPPLLHLIPRLHTTQHSSHLRLNMSSPATSPPPFYQSQSRLF